MDRGVPVLVDGNRALAVTPQPERFPPQFQMWIDARRRHRLSHAQVQMARELGLNPRKLGQLDNHHEEPWKTPLPQFIEELYLKRFGRERPAMAVPIEEQARQARRKKADRQATKAARAEQAAAPRQPGGSL